MKNAYPADCIMGNIVFLQEEKRIFGGRVVCVCVRVVMQCSLPRFLRPLFADMIQTFNRPQHHNRTLFGGGYAKE